MKSILLSSLTLLLVFSSCKKNKDKEEVGGCTDKDSPFIEKCVDFDNGSCKYLYVTEVEVRAFPERDGSQAWDAAAVGNERKADLYGLIKPATVSSYNNYFATRDNEISNAVHTDIHKWTTATQFKLTNETWEYEIWDKDGAFAGDDDQVAIGTFNPITSYSASNNWIDIFNPNGTHVRLKVLAQ